MEKTNKILLIVAVFFALTLVLFGQGKAKAELIAQEATTIQGIASSEAKKALPSEEKFEDPEEPENPLANLEPAAAQESVLFDETTYTLGPDDVIEIIVLRHPEFSGVFPVNKEGKIQFKFVGDIEVNGLTKQGLEEKIKKAISTYVIAPEVNVTINEYKSKVFYVLGEVGAPGKYYMRAEKLPVREAIFQAGLPTHAAAMRKCKIISPDEEGKARIRKLDLYSLLYGGDLRKDINIFPGDVLYVPSTVMAKVIRIINPVASTIGIASGTPEDINTGRRATEAFGK